MKKHFLLAVLILPLLLSGCSQAPVRKEWVTDLLYVGTYRTARISDGTDQDYFIHFAFPSSPELSDGVSRDPDVSIDLATDGKELSGDKDVGYVDVGREYRSATGGSLSDLVASGGMVEVFLSVGPYDASNRAVSGRCRIIDLGYTYTLNGFSVDGESLTFRRTKIFRQYMMGGTDA